MLGPASGQYSDGAHSGLPSSLGIVWSVPDREALVRLHAEPIQRRFEDVRMRLAVLGIVRGSLGVDQIVNTRNLLVFGEFILLG